MGLADKEIEGQIMDKCTHCSIEIPKGVYQNNRYYINPMPAQNAEKALSDIMHVSEYIILQPTDVTPYSIWYYSK